MRIHTLLMLVFLLVPGLALAGPEMAVWADTGLGLSPDLTTQTGVSFTIVVTLDSDGNDVLAAEFVLKDPRLVFPGLFALETKKLTEQTIDLGQNELGEYLMAFGRCIPPGDRIELVRITYSDFTGVIGSKSALITLRGLQIGDTQPSTFQGSPGFVECNETDLHYAEMGGNENEGALCINCFEPPEVEATITELKSKF